MHILRALIAAGVRNPVLANLLMLCILIGGAFSAHRMTREIFPDVSLDHIAIEVAYPGASTEDVEHAICTPIEEALRGLTDVREMSAAANEHFGTVWVGLSSDVKDVGAIVQEIKDRVDQITDWPPEAEKPVVREKALRSEVINIAISGDAPEWTLAQYAREVENDLATFPEISQISLVGVRESEIIIEVSQEALQAYHLSIEQLMAVVAKSSLNVPAGLIRTAGEEVTVRVTGQRLYAAEYEELVVLETSSGVVRMRDVANIREGFEDTVVRGRFNGEPSVMVAVYKTPEEDSVRIAQVVRDYVASRQPQLPQRLKMSVWGDASVDINYRISNLISNGLQGLLVLFITMWIFLEFGLAFWVAAGIPISFAGALLFMDQAGQTINIISLFALIMVSGIIVDDSIVIGEMVHVRRKAGDPPNLAAVEGTSRVALPVLGSTLTTIASFVPLLFVVGVMGRFIYVLPIVVIGALLASTVEGFLIQPAHMTHGQKPGVAYTPKPPNRVRVAIDRGIDYVVLHGYRRLNRLAVRNYGVTICLAVGLLLAGLGVYLGGYTPFVLLPKEDGGILRARVRFPEGTPASVAQRTIEKLETAAHRLNEDPTLKPASPGPLVRQVFSTAGEFSDFLPVRGSNLCEVRLEMMPPWERKIHDDVIIEKWRQYIGPVHDATEFRITRQQIGPTEQPIEIRLLGQDLDRMTDASRRIQSRLREFDGVQDVHDDLVPGKRQVRVTLRPAARALGLTLDDVARQLRHGFFGGEAVKMYRGRDQVTVRVRYPESERRSIVDLENLRISTPRGDEVPFLEVAEVTWDRGYAMVMHQDGRRRVRILADIDERRANAEKIVSELQRTVLPDILEDYHNVSYVFGGDRARASESLGSLWKGWLLAMIANYAFLSAVLRSYVKPIVIVAAIPFGLIGVIAGHLIFGYDLTMMSLFGIVGVSGLVVNQSLALVDTINWSISREGKTVREAVSEAGENRFRSVVITSITDLAGLTPLLLQGSGTAQAVQPMAVALSFGLLASAALNLLVVPSLYLAVNEARRFLYWLRYGGVFPAPEVVEEAVADRVVSPA